MMEPEPVIDFPVEFLHPEARPPDKKDVRFLWPKTDRYEVYEQGEYEEYNVLEEEHAPWVTPHRSESAHECYLVAPHPDREYPDDYVFYHPGEEDIYSELVGKDNFPNLAPDDFLDFATNYGLLGTWFREARFEKEGDSIKRVNNPWLARNRLTVPGDPTDPSITVSGVEYFQGATRGQENLADIPARDLFGLLGERVHSGGRGPAQMSATYHLRKFEDVLRFFQGEDDLRFIEEYPPPTWKPVFKKSWLDQVGDRDIFPLLVDSLLDVALIQSWQNQLKLSTCPECNKIFVAGSHGQKGQPKRFCKAAHRDRYNRRLNSQRESWKSFLNEHDRDIYEVWDENHMTDPPNPRAEKRFQHPVERLGELEGAAKRLAIEWAKKVWKRSTRANKESNTDPLLQPILNLEDDSS